MSYTLLKLRALYENSRPSKFQTLDQRGSWNIEWLQLMSHPIYLSLLHGNKWACTCLALHAYACRSDISGNHSSWLACSTKGFVQRLHELQIISHFDEAKFLAIRFSFDVLAYCIDLEASFSSPPQMEQTEGEIGAVDTASSLQCVWAGWRVCQGVSRIAWQSM